MIGFLWLSWLLYMVLHSRIYVHTISHFFMKKMHTSSLEVGEVAYPSPPEKPHLPINMLFVVIMVIVMVLYALICAYTISLS